MKIVVRLKPLNGDPSINKCIEIKEIATDGFNNIFTNFGSKI